MANVKISDLPIASTITPSTDYTLIVSGGVTKKVTPNILVNSVLTGAGYTIATLPSGVLGMRAYVTNGQTTPTFLGTVSTTGAVTAPVFYNGTAWVYG